MFRFLKLDVTEFVSYWPKNVENIYIICIFIFCCHFVSLNYVGLDISNRLLAPLYSTEEDVFSMTKVYYVSWEFTEYCPQAEVGSKFQNTTVRETPKMKQKFNITFSCWTLQLTLPWIFRWNHDRLGHLLYKERAYF